MKAALLLASCSLLPAFLLACGQSAAPSSNTHTQNSAGSPTQNGSANSTVTRVEKIDPPPKPKPSWANKPLRASKGTCDGLAFSMELPEGFEIRTEPKYRNDKSVYFQYKLADEPWGPEICVTRFRKETPIDAKAALGLWGPLMHMVGTEYILETEKLDAGWLFLDSAKGQESVDCRVLIHKAPDALLGASCNYHQAYPEHPKAADAKTAIGRAFRTLKIE